MNNKRAFTLIELLAVIVILALTFLFVMPQINSVMKKGENSSKELIEERVITAAKEYIVNYDSGFYDNIINVGDYNYVYIDDLINNGLITEDDINELDEFTMVKCELIENDKFKYTIIYE